MVREGLLNKATVEQTCHPFLSSASGEGSAIQPANDGRAHGTEAEVTESETGTVPVLVKPRSPACVLRCFRRVYPGGVGGSGRVRETWKQRLYFCPQKALLAFLLKGNPAPTSLPPFNLHINITFRTTPGKKASQFICPHDNIELLPSGESSFVCE